MFPPGSRRSVRGARSTFAIEVELDIVMEISVDILMTISVVVLVTIEVFTTISSVAIGI